MTKIVLVEDDASLRGAVDSFLRKSNFQVQAFDRAENALKAVDDGCDLVLSDVMMPGLTGFQLLDVVKQKSPKTPVILMTAFGTIEKAVDAMKHGAYDFLVKPFSLNLLETAIQSAILDKKSLNERESGDMPVLEDAGSVKSVRFGGAKVSERFITNNPKMLDLIENIKRIAPSKATVLIQGESGTGKELIAKMIHEFSPRSERIFVAINCAAMPDTLLESELFGHEKGSFTGAVARQIGKFEHSNNGTILLDEISEMSLTMQTKLLRVLQECEIYRVGGVKPIPLNLRVIATTNRDLFQYTKDGNFREDLFYRINVIPIFVPPLRERGDDVVLLSQEFLNEFAALHARPTMTIDDSIKKRIKNHPWYGNVRELRNAMERAILVGDFDVIEEGNIGSVAPGKTYESADAGDSETQFKKGMTLNDIEKVVILKSLEECDGNKTHTAARLGISLRTLRNKLSAYELEDNKPAKSSGSAAKKKKVKKKR